MERAPVPDKCDTDVTVLKFAAWRRSVEDCLAFRRVNNPVHWVRLLCTSGLQQILDRQYDAQEWGALCVSEALDAVGDAAVVRESPCALWRTFFSAGQRENESAVKYYRRVQHCASW